MVTIMIEGGMQSIDQAVSTLRKGENRFMEKFRRYQLCTFIVKFLF